MVAALNLHDITKKLKLSDCQDIKKHVGSNQKTSYDFLGQQLEIFWTNKNVDMKRMRTLFTKNGAFKQILLIFVIDTMVQKELENIFGW